MIDSIILAFGVPHKEEDLLYQYAGHPKALSPAT